MKMLQNRLEIYKMQRGHLILLVEKRYVLSDLALWKP